MLAIAIQWCLLRKCYLELPPKNHLCMKDESITKAEFLAHYLFKKYNASKDNRIYSRRLAITFRKKVRVIIWCILIASIPHSTKFFVGTKTSSVY